MDWSMILFFYVLGLSIGVLGGLLAFKWGYFK